MVGLECMQRLRDKLRTSESVLNDISQREGRLSIGVASGEANAAAAADNGSSLDEFAPFRLADTWIGGLPTVNPGASAAQGAPPTSWQDALRAAAQQVDRWSRQGGLLLKRNANVRVYGLVYLALLHVYFLYSFLRLFL